jgi:hypothetical protein
MTQVLAPALPLVLIGLTMALVFRRLLRLFLVGAVALIVLSLLVSAATGVRTAKPDSPPDCAAQAATAATGLAATVADYRSAQNIRGSRNVAATSSCLDGIFSILVAVSGVKSPPGSVDLPSDPVFDTFDPVGNGNTREYDSERKLLETINAATTPSTRGTVFLLSERRPCDSCAGVVTQFRASRPLVMVQIV